MIRTFFSSRLRPRNRSPQPRHPWAVKHLSKVQRQLSVSRSKRASQGFAMFVILLLMLTVLTTTVSLNTRTTAGMFVSSWQGKLRLARDAAENGVMITVGELNKPGNRMLLGSVPLNEWTTNNYKVRTDGSDVTISNNNVIYPGDCRFLDFDVYRITQEALDLAPINPPIRTVRFSDNGQYFRVLGIVLKNGNRGAIARSDKLSDSAVSYLTMTVEGIYSSDAANRPTAETPYPENSVHYTIQQEYKVVPRCCKENKYPVDTPGNTQSACQAVGKSGNYKPEWMLRSVAQAGLFKTN